MKSLVKDPEKKGILDPKKTDPDAYSPQVIDDLKRNLLSNGSELNTEDGKSAIYRMEEKIRSGREKFLSSMGDKLTREDFKRRLKILRTCIIKIFLPPLCVVRNQDYPFTAPIITFAFYNIILLRFRT